MIAIVVYLLATCAGWLGSLPQTCLSGSLELPYANAAGARVDQASARLFGHDLGRALSVYLKSQQS